MRNIYGMYTPDSVIMVKDNCYELQEEVAPMEMEVVFMGSPLQCNTWIILKDNPEYWVFHLPDKVERKN